MLGIFVLSAAMRTIVLSVLIADKKQREYDIAYTARQPYCDKQKQKYDQIGIPVEFAP